MHDIEPFYKWRTHYRAEEDRASPFYGRTYSEFQYSNRIYNYYIHPQWDSMESATLFSKILYADYADNFALIELIGEWNDVHDNDGLHLKTQLGYPLMKAGITKFVFLCDNVLNFHGDIDDYYVEWQEEVQEEGGWIACINMQEHVLKEMENYRLQYSLILHPELDDVNWRVKDPRLAYEIIVHAIQDATPHLK